MLQNGYVRDDKTLFDRKQNGKIILTREYPG